MTECPGRPTSATETGARCGSTVSPGSKSVPPESSLWTSCSSRSSGVSVVNRTPGTPFTVSTCAFALRTAAFSLGMPAPMTRTGSYARLRARLRVFARACDAGLALSEGTVVRSRDAASADFSPLLG
jgi:hypothetical protein